MYIPSGQPNNPNNPNNPDTYLQVGIHHVTLEAPLTHGVSYGTVEVYKDRLELKGQGNMRTCTMPFKN